MEHRSREVRFWWIAFEYCNKMQIDCIYMLSIPSQISNNIYTS
jgi:hypothetical protein